MTNSLQQEEMYLVKVYRAMTPEAQRALVDFSERLAAQNPAPVQRPATRLEGGSVGGVRRTRTGQGQPLVYVLNWDQLATQLGARFRH